MLPGPVSGRATAPSWCETWCTSDHAVCTYHSASFSRTAGLRIAGPSSSSSVRASAKISSKSGPGASPTASRSFISVVSDTFQPSPTLPSRWASGTRTSVKNTSLKLRGAGHLLDRPHLDARRFHVEKEEGQALHASAHSGSVRVTMMPKSAKCAPEVQIFWPLTIQSSPSRSARVRSAARSEPPAGSENNWHQISSPRSAGRT